MRAFLAVVLAIAAIPGVVAAEPKSLPEVEEFAFGGIGEAGTESQGERFFRGVMNQADALATFKTVLSKGTAAARLYALCGVRLLSEKDFAAAAEPLLKSNETVTTIGGCMILKQRVADVARQISLGSFDLTLKNPRHWPNQN